MQAEPRRQGCGHRVPQKVHIIDNIINANVCLLTDPFLIISLSNLTTERYLFFIDYMT